MQILNHFYFTILFRNWIASHSTSFHFAQGRLNLAMTRQLKLFQKSHIWIHKVPEIRDSIFYHYETIHPSTKCKTTIDFWIESCFSQYGRMDESCSHKLNPTGSFTYSTFFSSSIAKRTRKINLYSWLYKRKISGSHSAFYSFSKNI